MRVCLTGHSGSKLIIPTSSWLWNKYAPQAFRVEFLNFGDYNGELFCGRYIQLAEEQVGGKGAWSEYVYKYIKELRDKYVVLGCDDFLINGKVNSRLYRKMLTMVKDNVVCARLGDATWYKEKDYSLGSDGIMLLKNEAPYSCTGQLTVWNREILLKLLDGAGDVWNFESRGSQMMMRNGWRTIASYDPPFKYHTISALSGADKKIDLGGINKKDKQYIINNLITDGEVKK